MKTGLMLALLLAMPFGGAMAGGVQGGSAQAAGQGAARAAAATGNAVQPAIAPDAAAAPYVLENTEVRPIRSAILGRDYELFVSLPASYAKAPERRYPVLFVTDANYAFPLIRAIARRVANGGRDVEDFILVGLSYAVGETPEYSRRRDYTPTPDGDPTVKSDMSGRPVQFGGAEQYRRFLADEVFPFVANHYRADMTRKVFTGHSYGGLFGAHVLLTDPSMFSHYILSSPSLWFGRRAMFDREAGYAKANKDLRANVLLAVGALETADPAKGEDDDMVADTLAFERLLRSRGYPGLRVNSAVIADEDHLSVAPAILTRGLKWALAPRPAAR